MTEVKSEDAVKAILSERGNAILVPTMTAIKWVDKHDPEGLNISCVPLMGGASALGLGLALACPDRVVVVLDGDGSLLMQLPSLVTIAANGDANLIHVVFNNGVWFENFANIPLPGAQRVDFRAAALAAGYKDAFRLTRENELVALLPRLMNDGGAYLIEAMIEPESSSLWNSRNLQPNLADFHFNRLGDEMRRVQEHLRQHRGQNNEAE